MAFIDVYTTAYDGEFQSRVLYAVTKVARDAFGGAGSDAYKATAQDVLRNPRGHLEPASLVVVTNASIAATINAGDPVPDGDIEYAATEYLTALSWAPGAV